jgi:hypothetical protein
MRTLPALRHLTSALALVAAATASAAESRSTSLAAPPVSAVAPVTNVPLPPPPALARAAPQPESDSERAMGTWAMVVFNTQPFNFPNSGGATPLPLTVYTAGLRHWIKEPYGRFKNWGLDAGVGLVVSRSSVTSPQSGSLRTNEGPSVSGLGLHVGLPLAMTHHQHATFELVPEIDLIYASEKIPALGSGDDTTYSGFSVRAGARAGFELYFGFVGIPQLAIEASMGAAVTFDSVKSSVGPIERSTRTWGFSTLRGTEPWSIFTGSVAAMYHF